jgi:hypothetical protein
VTFSTGLNNVVKPDMIVPQKFRAPTADAVADGHDLEGCRENVTHEQPTEQANAAAVMRVLLSESLLPSACRREQSFSATMSQRRAAFGDRSGFQHTATEQADRWCLAGRRSH